MSPEVFLPIFAIFLPAVILHECAHGWVANKLGDPTAKRLGRLTLNPIKHIDPVGTVFLPLVLILTGSPVILGWAKPVPINPLNLSYPKRDMMWVGLAGPGINIILAVLLSLFLKLNLSQMATELIEAAIVINLILAVFNMIPIPPLDGSRFIMGLLPNRYAILYGSIEKYGILIIFVLLYFGLLRQFILPVVLLLAQILGVH